MTRFLTPAITLACAAAVVACGGNVAVDRGSGASNTSSSGATTTTASTTTTSTTITGTTTSTTTTSTTTTTGTTTSTDTTPVPACECAAITGFLSGCGYKPPPTCDFAERDCVCAAMAVGCAGVDACLPNPGEPGLPLACRKCFVQAVQGPCAKELDVCKQNPECQAELDCHKACQYTADCNAKCDAAHPKGAGDYATLVMCADCGQCANECGGTDLFASYCVYGGK